MQTEIDKRVNPLSPAVKFNPVAPVRPSTRLRFKFIFMIPPDESALYSAPPLGIISIVAIEDDCIDFRYVISWVPDIFTFRSSI